MELLIDEFTTSQQQPPPTKRRRISDLVKPPCLKKTSLLDLPRDLLITILSMLHQPTHIITRRTLREFESIAAFAMTCRDAYFLVYSVYSVKMHVFDTCPSRTFWIDQKPFPVGPTHYPSLVVLPYFCRDNLHEVRLSRGFCTDYVETFLVDISRVCQNVRKLSFYHNSKLHPNYLSCLDELQCLTSLEVGDPSTTVLGFLEHNIPSLTELSLVGLPITLLACLQHTLNSRISQMNWRPAFKHLETLRVLFQEDLQIPTRALDPFIKTLRYHSSEYLKQLRHLHIISWRWTEPLVRILPKVIPPSRICDLPNLKFEITSRSRRYGRRQSSIVARGNELPTLSNYILSPSWEDLTSQSVKTAIQELEQVEAVIISNCLLKKLVLYTTPGLKIFLDLLKQVDGIEELVWTADWGLSVETIKLGVEFSSNMLRCLPCVRCLKIVLRERCWQQVSKLFESCENIETICLNFPSTRSVYFDSEARILISAIKLIQKHCPKLKYLAVTKESYKSGIGRYNLRALNDQIDKFETQFPHVDIDSLRLLVSHVGGHKADT